MVSERVTREGDTVTVRSCGEPDDSVAFYPDEDVFLVNVDSTTGLVMLECSDLIALAHHLLDLAGEPDWQVIARKLGRVVSAEDAYDHLNWHLVRTTNAGYQEYRRVDAEMRAARAAITADEWELLEGDDDGE